MAGALGDQRFPLRAKVLITKLLKANVNWADDNGLCRRNDSLDVVSNVEAR